MSSRFIVTVIDNKVASQRRNWGRQIPGRESTASSALVSRSRAMPVWRPAVPFPSLRTPRRCAWVRPGSVCVCEQEAEDCDEHRDQEGVGPDHDLSQQLQPVEASDDDVQLPVVFVQPAVLLVEPFFESFFPVCRTVRRSADTPPPTTVEAAGRWLPKSWRVAAFPQYRGPLPQRRRPAGHGKGCLAKRPTLLVGAPGSRYGVR